MTAPDLPVHTLAYPPPTNPDEAEDERLDEVEAQDRSADKWPAMAWALFDGTLTRSRRHDLETTTVEDAAVFERHRSPDREVRVGAQRRSIDDVPDRIEL